jgi:hypothetical protein
MKQSKIISPKIVNEIARAARNDHSYVHVIARGDKWIIKKHGAARAYRIYSSKNLAINAAKQYKLKANINDVIVHDRMGNIESVH